METQKQDPTDTARVGMVGLPGRCEHLSCFCCIWRCEALGHSGCWEGLRWTCLRSPLCLMDLPGRTPLLLMPGDIGKN